MQHQTSAVLAVIALAGIALALLAKLGAKQAMSRPMVHDGIGGKDTDNLATGCFGILFYWFIGGASVVLLVIAGAT